MAHHLDRFQSAVMILAGHGDVKQRLMRAYADNLESIPEGELPGELATDFVSLKTRMTAVSPFSNETAICASVRKMSADEASACAKTVVSMYSLLIRGGPVDDQVPEDREEPDVTVPPFLVKSVS